MLFYYGYLGSKASRLQASMVGDDQDGVSYQNTWCSRTSCGGIDSYTYMAAHGPRRRRWPSLPEQVTWITQLNGVLCGIYGDQLDDQGNLVGQDRFCIPCGYGCCNRLKLDSLDL
jgi:ribosomal protein S27AE